MKRYGLLNLEKNSLFNVNIGLKKSNIFVENTSEILFSDETFKITPFGAYPHDLKILNEKMDLLLRDKKIKNWCLILPDSWQKSLYLEEENIPKSSKELKIFIEWHFKKSYNLRPDEIRFSYILKHKNGKNGLFINFSLEKLLSSIEEIFKNKNKHLGFIISSFWALSFLIPKKGIWALLNIDREVWTFGLFEGEELVSFRQKIIPKENPSSLIEEVLRTIGISGKNIDYFYFNLNNDEIKKEDFIFPFNLLTPDLENIKFLCEPPQWWENLGNIFLGALYGLP